ncbi:hypothetical protein [Methylobacterium sp. WL103]|uniref:hypothetical protein n=1 Tax=Methylobacterium sp. WL103 TaxID=2603891 RepID=UPI001FEFBF13|nr:hypothetical protein [Methylobacterium sp. WL103]
MNSAISPAPDRTYQVTKNSGGAFLSSFILRQVGSSTRRMRQPMIGLIPAACALVVSSGSPVTDIVSVRASAFAPTALALATSLSMAKMLSPRENEERAARIECMWFLSPPGASS